MKKTFPRLVDMEALVGKELAVSDWLLVDQQRIARFADATDDHQWIHLDAERAAASPFGSTIAHGFLTLSLLPTMMLSSFEIADSRMAINYGVGKVRFPAPVRSGSRVRARSVLKRFEPIEGGAQLTFDVAVECDGVAGKPVCAAEFLLRFYL